MSNPQINEYLVALIPKTIIGNLNLSNKEIVALLKVNDLYIKIINFNHQLLLSNQRVSEGKDTCPVNVTWKIDSSYVIPGINCGQVKYLLRNMKKNQDFGKVVELSCRYLQALKFTHNMKSKNLVYNSDLI